ncbi:MAG TPA: AgmX/PglI C-terminal domain-containing protein [Steroidobacteraceae bacterium]|nr:AgmX/PglI C-terminal domain-containing protein [Steroidobacteraceae bacterium]
MTVLATNYRVFELPWTPNDTEERHFKRLLRIGLLLWLIVVVGTRLLPTPERPMARPLPEEVVKLVLQPPLPKPKPVEEKKPEPKPIEKPKPIVPPPVVDKTEQARKKAQKALNQVKDELADLRAALNTEQLASAKPLKDKVDGPARAERSLITSNLTGGSGGINTAALSSGFGSGPGSLHGHSTMQGVQSFADGIRKDHAEAKRTGSSGKASRSREEIEMVFDRNKAAIYALYNRALRDNPQLQGKVVVQLTIAPTGEVTDCKVLSSELKDDELERKLVARIKMFRFDDKDVEIITTTKPIDFFPA